MARICVADIEADGLLDEATRAWCMVFKDINTNELYKFDPDSIQDGLKFMDSCDVCIMHNGIGYDWPLLERLYGYEYKGKKIDTLLMSRLQKPNRQAPRGCKSGPHSVEAWGMRFGRLKPEHEDWSQYSKEMLHRCAEDVEIQYRIYKHLIDEGKGQNWKEAHRLTHQLFTILQKQEEYGWLVDREYMDKCVHQLTFWMDRIDRVLDPLLPMRCIPGTPLAKPFLKSGKYGKFCIEWMGDMVSQVRGPFSRVRFEKVDLGSNQQTKEYLLSQGWVPQRWNMRDGVRTSPKLSHDEEFEGITGGVGRLIARRVQCRHRRSQIEGWINSIRPDGRVAQRITGIAATGRLTHAGIVNVPGSGAFYGKQMRKCFICKPGYKLVGVDSDACQNRMLAARVGDPEFTKTLLDGKKEDFTSIHYVNMKAIKKHAGLDVSYKICKNLNYAFMFGAQDPKLAATAGVPEKMGAAIRKGLLSVSPGLEALVTSLQEEWRATATPVAKGRWVQYKNGCITGLDGRPVMIEKEHTLLVYMLQSDEAIMMQYALCFLYKWCQQQGWVHGVDYGFVGNIHDEFQVEVREELADQLAKLGEKCITKSAEYLHIGCPHQGNAEIGDNWYETH